MPKRPIFYFLLSAACWFIAASPVRAQEKSTISKEDQTRIAGAKKADEAIDLGKEFLTNKRLAATTAAVERACTLQPDLLTDSKAQTPEEWNHFWFTERAAIQEKRLAKTDGAGRVKLALWLKDAGMAEPAADMLAAALAIDKNLPEAQELAKKWNVSARDPMRIDLGVRLKEPLLLKSFKDENLEVMLRKERQFLLVPVSYNPGNNKLPINKTLLKVTSDDGKLCVLKGIVLLKSSAPATANSGDVELSIQEPTEPLWERLQVERKTNQNEYELSCFNTTPATAPPTKQRTPGGQRQPAARDSTIAGKQNRPGSGYVGFLAEVPAEMSAVDLEFHGQPPLRLKADFLKALATPLDKAHDEKTISILIAESASPEAIVAAAAVKRLGQIRKAAPPAPSTADNAKPKTSGEDKIERALLMAMGHADPVTQRASFEALVLQSANLSTATATLDMIRNSPAPIVLALVEQTATALNAPVIETGAPPTAGAPTAEANDAVGRAVAGLPASKVSPNVFAVLATCLKHNDGKVHERVLQLLLDNGTRESVTVLAKSTGPAREALITKVGSVAKPDVKAAVVRCLLAKAADPATSAKLMANAGALTVTITKDDDPLITALGGQSSPDAVKRLLELIGESDLSAIANADVFKKTLTGLATAQQNDAGVRGALLKLAIKNLHTAYEAPVKRERNAGVGAASSSAFEAALAILAAGPDAETAHAAAEALIRSGRIGALNEHFKQVLNSRRQDVISYLFNKKALWEGEALPVFLVSRFSDTEAKAAQPALAALALMQKGIDPKQRWRLNLSIKQELELHKLIELSVDSDEAIAQPATELLLRLATLPAADETEVRNAIEVNGREQKLNAVEQTRTTAIAAGKYAAILYVDIARAAPPAAAGSANTAAEKSIRNNIPLPLGVIDIRREGQVVHVVANGQELQLSSEAGQPALRVNVAPLLRIALESPEAQKESLADQVDLSVLNQERACILKYERLGTWSSETTIEDTLQSTENEKPLHLVGAKLVLEPMPTK